MPFNLIRPQIAIFIIFFITFSSLILGSNSWPFFAYPMYSHKRELSLQYVLMAERTDGSVYQIRSHNALFPIKPNGITEKLLRIMRSPNKEARAMILLEYVYNRLVKKDLLLKCVYIIKNEFRNYRGSPVSTNQIISFKYFPK